MNIIYLLIAATLISALFALVIWILSRSAKPTYHFHDSVTINNSFSRFPLEGDALQQVNLPATEMNELATLLGGTLGKGITAYRSETVRSDLPKASNSPAHTCAGRICRRQQNSHNAEEPNPR